MVSLGQSALVWAGQGYPGWSAGQPARAASEAAGHRKSPQITNAMLVDVSSALAVSGAAGHRKSPHITWRVRGVKASLEKSRGVWAGLGHHGWLAGVKCGLLTGGGRN